MRFRACCRPGDMHQERSLVHQVERALLQRVGKDVVALDLEIAAAVIREEAKVQVSGQDAAAGADLLGQPPRYAPGPAADLQAAPARANAQLSEVADRGAVEQVLQGAQPRMLPLPGLVEDVAARWSASPSRSVDLAVHAFPVGLAQLVLEHLALGRQRQRVCELDAPGSLVVGDQGLAVRADLPGSHAVAGPWDDDGVHPLAQVASGTPITAQAATAGCEATAFSTSTEYTLDAPVMIMSLRRSTRWT
jgi:hypothetical protein